MKILITDRVGNIPDHVKEYAHAKVEVLESFFGDTGKVEIVFHAEGNKAHAEMMVSAARRATRLIAAAQADDFQSVVDVLVDKIERQMHKMKDKRRAGRRRSAGSHPLAAAQAGIEEPQEEEVTYEDIIEEIDL